MRSFITILLLFVFVSLRGQSIQEKFISEVYKSLVDTTSIPYNLSESTTKFLNHKFFDHQLTEDLLKHVPDTVLVSLQRNIESDTANYQWTQASLKDIVLLNSKQVDTTLGNIITVSYNGESRSQYKAKTKLLASKREGVYFFSNPVFDSSGEYSVIQVGYVCGNACGRQCLVLFKKVDGHWVKLTETSCALA